MRSDARKRTAEVDPRPCKGGNSNICVAEGCYGEACVEVARKAAADPLAPFVALAEAADRQFGSAQVITRDALWAAIAVARGDQS